MRRLLVLRPVELTGGLKLGDLYLGGGGGFLNRFIRVISSLLLFGGSRVGAGSNDGRRRGSGRGKSGKKSGG